MAKFKVGQKVRIKQWLDMPEELSAIWGNNPHAETTGIVKCINNTAGFMAYDVKPDGQKYSCFCLKEELEPVIRVGEQLIFDFIKQEE